LPLIKWIIIAFLSLPVIEIAAFVAVASTIGVLLAFALLIATSLLGSILLRHYGTENLVRLKVAAGGNVEALRLDSAGLANILGAFLLVLPGFVTDIIGLALLVPPIQRRILGAFGLQPGRPAPRPGVVDLDPEEWRRERDPALTDARRPPDSGRNRD
jgi:UPF0716 protein FxsA